MLPKRLNKLWSLVPLYWILSLALLLLAGCGGNEITISLRPVSATPPVQTHGEPVRISVEPSDESAEIIYKWNTMEQDCGEIQIFSETEPLAEYRPPKNVQVQKKCTVKVEGVSNEKKIGPDYLEVEIIPDEVVPTATRPPSPSPVPSSSSEPTGTGPVPCQSFRVPLSGSAVDVEAEFASLQPCQRGLPKTLTIGGSYSGNLGDRELWVLVYPSDGKYYPQALDACEQPPPPSKVSEGTWRTTVNFGGPPQQYDVVLVVADKNGEASIEFTTWLQEGCKSGQYPGYFEDELPGGLTEVAAITVSTE